MRSAASAVASSAAACGGDDVRMATWSPLFTKLQVVRNPVVLIAHPMAHPTRENNTPVRAGRTPQRALALHPRGGDKNPRPTVPNGDLE